MAGPREIQDRAGSAGEVAEKGAEQRCGQAAGAPVAIAGAYIHPDQLGEMVGISQGLHPGDRIGNRFIKAAVLPVELTVGFAATVDQAIAAVVVA